MRHLPKVIRTYFSRVLLLVFFTYPSFSRADSIDMAYIPEGAVLMGDDYNLHDEKPARNVTTSDYFIDVYEVNIWQWEKVATWRRRMVISFPALKKRERTDHGGIKTIPICDFL